MMLECDRLREQTGLTLKEIAAIMRCSVSTVQRWELGTHPQPQYRGKIRRLILERGIENVAKA
jgi:DNA-binding transcriptional regulator YiaG